MSTSTSETTVKPVKELTKEQKQFISETAAKLTAKQRAVYDAVNTWTYTSTAAVAHAVKGDKAKVSSTLANLRDKGLLVFRKMPGKKNGTGIRSQYQWLKTTGRLMVAQDPGYRQHGKRQDAKKNGGTDKPATAPAASTTKKRRSRRDQYDAILDAAKQLSDRLDRMLKETDECYSLIASINEAVGTARESGGAAAKRLEIIEHILRNDIRDVADNQHA